VGVLASRSHKRMQALYSQDAATSHHAGRIRAEVVSSGSFYLMGTQRCFAFSRAGC
jgi:hypothetical protein